MQIKETTVLVTGGASGLGAACVRRFASQGARVVIVDLNAKQGAALAAEIGQQARFVQADVSSEADVQAAIQVAVEQFGGLHVALNCAGIVLGERTVGKNGPHDLAQDDPGVAARAADRPADDRTRSFVGGRIGGPAQRLEAGPDGEGHVRAGVPVRHREDVEVVERVAAFGQGRMDPIEQRRQFAGGQR